MKSSIILSFLFTILLSAQTTPVITEQPKDQTVGVGGTAIFTCNFTGPTNKGYQWWKVGGSKVIDSEGISGATTNQLTISNVSLADNGSQYLCETKDLDFYPQTGSWVNTEIATLSIQLAPTMTLTSNDLQSVNEGESYLITWNSENIQKVKITIKEFMVNDGLFILEDSLMNTGSYNFLIENRFAASTYEMKIKDINSDVEITDIFSINKINYWEQVFSSTEVLNEIVVLDKNTILLSGDNMGYRSLDGGKTWISDENLIGRNLQFINRNIGWIKAVEPNNLIKKTTDGGLTWTNINTMDIGDLNIYFQDEMIVWGLYRPYTSGRNHLFNSVDGGITWTSKEFSNNYSFNKIYFVDSLSGFIVGTKYKSLDVWNSLLLKTNDGGDSWIDSTLSPKRYIEEIGGYVQMEDNVILSDIVFSDKTNGFAVGTNGSNDLVNVGLYFKTTDGGKTWNLGDVRNYFGYQSDMLRYHYFNSVTMIDSNIVWITGHPVAATDGPLVYNSNSGGKNWFNKHISSPKGVSISFSMLTNEYGFCLVKEMNNTYSVQRIDLMTNLAITPVITEQPKDQTVGVGGTAIFTCNFTGPTNKGYQWWKVGGSKVIDSEGISGATTNQLTISNVSLADNGSQYLCETKDLDFYPQAGSWVNSEVATLTIEQEPKIEITYPTGGTTWKMGETYTINWESENVDSVKIELLNDGVADKDPSTEIIETCYPSNGSYTFILNPSFNYETVGRIKLSDLNSNYYVISKQFRIEYQTTWQLKQTFENELFDIFFLNDRIGFLIEGNSLLKTTNSGKNWRKISSVNGTHIQFINESTGWIVGGNGSIQKSIDGGYSWFNQSSPTNEDLSKVFFLDKMNGWAFATNTLINTKNGGEDWTEIPLPDYSPPEFIKNFYDFSILNTNTFYLIGAHYDYAQAEALLIKTIDGGKNWSRINFDVTSRLLESSSICFLDSNIGFVSGTERTINDIWSEARLYKTTNGGQDWERIGIPYQDGVSHLTDSFILNETNYWLSVKYADLPIIYSSDKIFRINDFGIWINPIGIKKLFFTSPEHGWAITPDHIAYPPHVTQLNNLLEYGSSHSYQNLWKANLTVMNNNDVIKLEYGESSEASDGIDTLLNEVELPPPPPLGTFDVRFKLLNNIPSLVDIRNSSETEIIWELQFQPSSSGYPITFTWDSESPPFGSFFLSDVITGSIVNIDMKQQDSYTLTNESINKLQIVYKEENQSTIKNNSEWDLISIPLQADNMEVASLLPESNSSAFMFEGSYKSRENLENGVGYWVKFNNSDTTNIYGQEIVAPIPVKSGWNIIGAYNEEIPVSDLSTTPAGIISSSIYGFENGYFIADKLEAGNGYWVKATQAGEIIFSSSASLGKKANKLELSSDPQISFNIVANDGVSDSLLLTFGLDSLATNGYDPHLGEEELPPLPPIGVFDVRLELPDTLITTYSDIRLLAPACYEHIVNYQLGDSSEGLTLSWTLPEGVTLKITDLFGGTVFNESFESGESSFTITNTNVNNAKITICYTDIILSNSDIEDIPTVFSLSQNYPNPFNPNTKIRFGIPKESKVTLIIYNILGQEVRRLVNQQLKAGYHEVDLNISNYSSGIYFYRIQATPNGGQAGAFVETKKMILLK